MVTLNIYPNPFADELTIELCDSGTAKITQYNLYGQALFYKAFSNTTTFSTVHLPEGMYFYAISHNQKVVKTGKMIRQR